MASSRGQRKGPALAGAALLPAALAVACNGLIGLGEYQRVECTGTDLRCDDGGSRLDANVEPDAAVDGGGRGADPVSWAAWKMPNYDAGEALGPLPNPPSLVVTGAEISDKVTGLVWRSKLEGGGAPVSIDDARSACAAISPEWRLPKRIELVTLLDYGHGKPFIDGTKFAGFPSSITVWSSSEVRRSHLPQEPLSVEPGRYWTVNFGSGAVEQESGTAATLCVKGKS